MKDNSLFLHLIWKRRKRIMMGMNTANQKQIKLIKAYMQNETGLPYDRISEEEKNPTASFLGWIVAVLRFFAFDADSLLLPGYAFSFPLCGLSCGQLWVVMHFP
jgi:hypothetical protein